MLQKAKVIAIYEDTTAKVEVARESACGHDCGSCAGCGMQAAPIYTDAINRIGAQIGDTVEIETETSKILAIAGVVYLLPILLFFLTYFLLHAVGMHEALAIGLGGIGFALGFVIMLWLNRRISQNGVIRFNIKTILERIH